MTNPLYMAIFNIDSSSLIVISTNVTQDEGFPKKVATNIGYT